ncbi:hypothetical protein VNI00_012942 [Paramarasmius palmivorus]|uniref:Uncharacterized protein n=1 Tax=Paramarasmius palmivorus TaxID=297713 RepID=A0AAW0BYQ6_9AGAR
MFLTPKRVYFARGATPEPISPKDLFSPMRFFSPESKGDVPEIEYEDIKEEKEVVYLLVPHQGTIHGESESEASDSEMSSPSDEESPCQGQSDCDALAEKVSEDGSQCESYASDDGVTDFQEALQKWVDRDVAIFPPKSPPTYHELRAFGPTKFDARPEGMSEKDWKSVLTATFDRWWNDLYARHKAHTEYMARAQSPVGDRECSSRHSDAFWNEIDPQF